MTPEVTPEVTPEMTPEMTQEMTPEITPEMTQEMTPEMTQEMTPEITPEMTPEHVTDGDEDDVSTATSFTEAEELTVVPPGVILGKQQVFYQVFEQKEIPHVYQRQFIVIY